MAVRVTPQHWRMGACRLTFGTSCHLVHGYHLSASRRLWLVHGGGPGLASVYLPANMHTSWQARGPCGLFSAEWRLRWWMMGGWLARMFGDAEVR